MMQLEDLSWANIVSTVLGGGGASVIARWLFDKALQTLNEITHKLETVTQKLVVIEARLDDLKEDLKEVQPMVVDHDRKLAALEARLRPRKVSKGG